MLVWERLCSSLVNIKWFFSQIVLVFSSVNGTFWLRLKTGFNLGLGRGFLVVTPAPLRMIHVKFCSFYSSVNEFKFGSVPFCFSVNMMKKRNCAKK